MLCELSVSPIPRLKMWRVQPLQATFPTPSTSQLPHVGSREAAPKALPDGGGDRIPPRLTKLRSTFPPVFVRRQRSGSIFDSGQLEHGGQLRRTMEARAR